VFSCKYLFLGTFQYSGRVRDMTPKMHLTEKNSGLVNLLNFQMAPNLTWNTPVITGRSRYFCRCQCFAIAAIWCAGTSFFQSRPYASYPFTRPFRAAKVQVTELGPPSIRLQEPRFPAEEFLRCSREF
jgi:hypothetical protein